MRFFNLYFFAVLMLAFIACSDDDDGTEFMFDREVSEISVLKECSSGKSDSTGCFKIRYRYPILTDDYVGLRIWFDTKVVDDTSKAVSNKQIEKGLLFEYSSRPGVFYDTIDVTDSAMAYINDAYDSVQVAMYCEYSDGGDPGSLQRVTLHFVDDQKPSIVKLIDSVWSTGALFEWSRPTDKTDFLKQEFVSGPIYGYNVQIQASDIDEDIRNLTVMVNSPTDVDYSGKTIYKRHARIRRQASGRGVHVDTITNVDKNLLNLVILDGEGYDTEDPDNNGFRMIIEGLRTRSNSEAYDYSISIVAFDSIGNASDKYSKVIVTTDSIAPLMPTKIYTEEDSLFPGYTTLDSNNLVSIFWDVSLDPLKSNHGIEVDSVLVRPRGCNKGECFDYVTNYDIEYYNKQEKAWNKYSKSEDDSFEALYSKNKNGQFVYDPSGNFVKFTIHRVAPGDTLILRIRSIDASGYYSAALRDTVYVSPGALANELKCPVGFVAVSTSDTTSFCMERYEHRNAKGVFMNNVLHSEAVAACSEMSADGFEISLCRERDWELVCLSGGSLAYGVIEDGIDASVYLFSFCNVGTDDSTSAADIAKRNPNCMNPMGVRDLPGQYQEWVIGRSKDTAAVLKGSSYKAFDGLDRESIAYCTNRAFPYYTRPAYTQDTVYLYREGTKVDTVYAADTLRTLFKKLTKKDFKDTLQFFDVIGADGKVVGTDFSLYSEYKKGGDAWLDSLSNGLTYKPTRKEAVFLTGEKLYYREVSSFYRSPTIGFRCCAYKK